jgi:hypothetical protein
MEMMEEAMMVMNRRKTAAAEKNNKNTITSKDSPTPVEIIEVTANSILDNAFRTDSQLHNIYSNAKDNIKEHAACRKLQDVK